MKRGSLPYFFATASHLLQEPVMREVVLRMQSLPVVFKGGAA